MKYKTKTGKGKTALLTCFLLLLMVAGLWGWQRLKAQNAASEAEIQNLLEQLSAVNNENLLLEQKMAEVEAEMDNLVLGAVSEHGVQDFRAYLTFDDGPSQNTLKVMDILDAYGIKGTFFVNGSESELAREVYTRILEDDHVLGNHTYSHKYREIYQSWDAFYEELRRLETCVKEQTGYEMDHIVRFPGGSNSANQGVMKEIKKNLDELGYRYFDWNVSGEDAIYTGVSASEIYRNVVRYVEGKNVAVILLHTTNQTDATVEVLPDIIDYLVAEGYSFHTLDEDDAPGYVVFDERYR